MLAKEPDKPDPKTSDNSLQKPEGEAPREGEPRPPESEHPPTSATLPAGQKPPRKPIDEKTVAVLRAGAKRRRPWTLLTWLIVLLFLAIPVGLAAWALWPRTPPPNLVVTAFDEVALRGETANCRGQLEPVESETAGVNLGGRELTFEEQPPAGRQPELRQAKTTPEGTASVEWGLPAAEHFDFLIRYVHPDRVSDSVDRGRVFTWPKTTKLLLVDVAALTEKGEKIWDQGPTVALLPDAAAALQAAHTAKVAVVYLAVVPSRGTIYRQVRNWVKSHALQPADALPDGPVLGRWSVAAGDGAAGILALLKRFEGGATVIVRQAEVGEPYRAAGVRTLTVGPGGLDWKEAAKELAK